VKVLTGEETSETRTFCVGEATLQLLTAASTTVLLHQSANGRQQSTGNRQINNLIYIIISIQKQSSIV